MNQEEHVPTRARVVAGTIFLVGTFALACGTSAPTPSDAGSDANGSTGDSDASRADGDASRADGADDGADGGFAPIACGKLMCAGATPYCLKAHVCGFGPADCTTPTSDGGACPEGYNACEALLGTPGCLSLYTYSCVSVPSCKPIAPRTYGDCNC